MKFEHYQINKFCRFTIYSYHESISFVYNLEAININSYNLRRLRNKA
jgi:hypothetical protein